MGKKKKLLTVALTPYGRFCIGLEILNQHATHENPPRLCVVTGGKQNFIRVGSSSRMTADNRGRMIHLGWDMKKQKNTPPFWDFPTE